MILLHIPNQFNLQKHSHSIPHAKPTVTAFSALTRKLKLLPMHLYIRTIFAQCEIFHIGEYFALLTQSIFVYLRDLKFCVSFSFAKSQHVGCQEKAEITFEAPSTTKVSFQRQQRVMKKSIKQGKSSSEDRVGHFCPGHFGHRDRLDIIPQLV